MKESSINKIFGGTEKDRKATVEMVEESFREQALWERLERTKTREEIALMKLADEATGAIAKSYGAKNQVSVTQRNIHILKDEVFDKMTSYEKIKTKGRLVGFFSVPTQAIFLRDREDNFLALAQSLIHELYHFKSYESWAINTKDPRKSTLRHRRMGWGIGLKDREESAFADMDEAVTDALALKTLNEVVKTKTAATLEEAYEKKGFEEIYIESYGVEKLRLWDLLTKIKDAHKDKFKNTEDVFDVFAKAYFTSKLLPAARLVEKTFGKGSFRKIGEEGMPLSQIEKDIGEET